MVVLSVCERSTRVIRSATGIPDLRHKERHRSPGNGEQVRTASGYNNINHTEVSLCEWHHVSGIKTKDGVCGCKGWGVAAVSELVQQMAALLKGLYIATSHRNGRRHFGMSFIMLVLFWSLLIINREIICHYGETATGFLQWNVAQCVLM